MPLNIIRGLFRGATRGVLTGKKGNKQFYKGKKTDIDGVMDFFLYYNL